MDTLAEAVSPLAFCLLKAALLAAVLGTAQAREARLVVGDSAPPLQVGAWVQGEPVTAFERDKVYLIDFWAMWCGPCVHGIPALNALHERYQDRGLVVIGQNVWEWNPSLVKAWVAKLGRKMTFRVALDDLGQSPANAMAGAMSTTWMQAAGADGIPTAFLVGKDGKIAWIGNPHFITDALLERVLSGQAIDLANDEVSSRDEQERAENFQRARLDERFDQAKKAKNWQAFEACLPEMESLAKRRPDWATLVVLRRMQFLFGTGRPGEATQLARTSVASVAETDDSHDKDVLRVQLGDCILEEAGEALKGDVLETAYTLLAQAAKDGRTDAPYYLAHFAKACFLKGQKAEAIQLMERAISLAKNEGWKKQLQAMLDGYRSGAGERESGPATP